MALRLFSIRNVKVRETPNHFVSPVDVPKLQILHITLFESHQILEWGRCQSSLRPHTLLSLSRFFQLSSFISKKSLRPADTCLLLQLHIIIIVLLYNSKIRRRTISVTKSSRSLGKSLATSYISTQVFKGQGLTSFQSFHHRGHFLYKGTYKSRTRNCLQINLPSNNGKPFHAPCPLDFTLFSRQKFTFCAGCSLGTKPCLHAWFQSIP